jgi:hypothetical protein
MFRDENSKVVGRVRVSTSEDSLEHNELDRKGPNSTNSPQKSSEATSPPREVRCYGSSSLLNIAASPEFQPIFSQALPLKLNLTASEYDGIAFFSN